MHSSALKILLCASEKKEVVHKRQGCGGGEWEPEIQKKSPVYPLPGAPSICYGTQQQAEGEDR